MEFSVESSETSSTDSKPRDTSWPLWRQSRPARSFSKSTTPIWLKSLSSPSSETTCSVDPLSAWFGRARKPSPPDARCLVPPTHWNLLQEPFAETFASRSDETSATAVTRSKTPRRKSSFGSKRVKSWTGLAIPKTGSTSKSNAKTLSFWLAI